MFKKKYRLDFTVREEGVPEGEAMNDGFTFEYESEDYKSRQIVTLDILSLICIMYKNAILKGKTASEIFNDMEIEK